MLIRIYALLSRTRIHLRSRRQPWAPALCVAALALAANAMKKQFADFGAEPSPMTPEAFSVMVKSEIAKWSKVIKDAHIKPE